MKTIFTFIYFLGLLSCATQGVRKAADNYFCTQLCYVSAFLSSFAGGMIRDIMILHVYPVVFTSACLPDITTVIIAAFLYIRILRNQKQIKSFIIFTDSIGMAQFIVIGVDKALSLNNNYLLAVLSGACTSLGGGIVVSLIFSGESIRNIMLANLSYRLFSILGTVLYATLIRSDVNPIDAQMVMIIYTLCVLPICGNVKTLKKVCRREIRNTQHNKHCMNLICLNSIFLLYIYSRQYYYKLPRVTYISKRYSIRNNKRIIYFYHRIRQM